MGVILSGSESDVDRKNVRYTHCSGLEKIASEWDFVQDEGFSL